MQKKILNSLFVTAIITAISAPMQTSAGGFENVVGAAFGDDAEEWFSDNVNSWATPMLRMGVEQGAAAVGSAVGSAYGIPGPIGGAVGQQFGRGINQASAGGFEGGRRAPGNMAQQVQYGNICVTTIRALRPGALESARFALLHQWSAGHRYLLTGNISCGRD